MISIRMFAGTCVGLRENNEDDFTVCPDLMVNSWIVPDTAQTAIPLGKRGCLLVVADGMGGQNAGEVASDIAVRTVKEMFAPDVLPADVLDREGGIGDYLKKVIVEADIRVKQHGINHPEAEGLGSTIVMAWVVGARAYVAWLGDSRAYSYIPSKKIGRLSKDHSYVQKLVDAGQLSDDEAMLHRDSNIITRSLGDTTQKAKPEVVEHDLIDGELLLLCSDGLCGVCRDEEIGGIIDEDIDNLQYLKERLTSAALSAGGSDNITVALLQISIDGETSAIHEQQPLTGTSEQSKWMNLLIGLVGFAILSAVVFAGYALLQDDIPPASSSPSDTGDRIERQVKERNAPLSTDTTRTEKRSAAQQNNSNIRERMDEAVIRERMDEAVKNQNSEKNKLELEEAPQTRPNDANCGTHDITASPGKQSKITPTNNH